MVQYLNNNVSGFQQFSQMRAANDNKEPKKGFGFMGWILIFILIYWIFYPSKKNEAPIQTAEIEHIDISDVPRRTLADDKITATVQGLRISNINLTDYKAEKGEVENIELLSDEKEFIEIGLLADGTNVPRANTLWKTSKSTDFDKMRWGAAAGVSFTRDIKTSGDYVITVSDEIKNNSKKAIFVSQYSRIVRHGDQKNKLSVKTGGIANANGEIENESWGEITDNPPIYQIRGDQASFVGFTDQYWETIASSAQPSDKTIKIKRRADGLFQADVAPEYLKVEAGKSATLTTHIFAGPKTQDALAIVGDRIQNIDGTLDYGTFGFLSRPFLWSLGKLHDLIPNYGIAIILLTLIIRALMWPLTKKSYKSMAAMQKIQPEMQRVQKLYADDKLRMQQEIMRLYQTHKANPLSSIGTLLLQIPILFALYKALLIAVPLRHAGFLWLDDLSVMDPFFMLPLLMAATMFLQNRLSHNAQSDMPGMKVMKYMPLVFAGLFAVMPSGLVLYWTVSSIVGIIQMVIMKKGGKS
ncbi:MAG: membrane protein insertase YidC [Rickettsiales bacterium]|jgi:YidC/Oxa1 family membrane protein insertase|nr:membrane protein insertase YidC [Rickettsiales bacterium]